MRPERLLALTLLLSASLGGCGMFGGDKHQEEGMTISVDFREVHRCSRISPEITVAYAPEGTKFYDVRLVEHSGETERFLGGGRWPADETGQIPEGALTQHYMGPCPPSDRRVDYTYVVSALEEPDGQPLAVRLFRVTPD